MRASNLLVRLLVAVVMASISLAAKAQCDGRWLPPESLPGITGGGGNVRVAAAWDPDGSGPAAEWLIVGGDFREAGGHSARGIAAWNGREWMPMPGVSGGAYSIVNFNGRLIAAVYFVSSNGTIIGGGIAEWNGTAWTMLADGAPSDATLLIAHGSDLIAAQGTSPGRIFRWDGTTWTPMGTGWNEAVRNLHTSEGVLYVSTSLTVASRPIARVWWWTGANWELIGAEHEAWISSLATWNGALYAAQSLPLGSTRLLRWDGTAWQVHCTMGGGTIQKLFSWRGGLVAGGDFRDINGGWTISAAQWDGRNWSPLGFTLTSSGYSPAVLAFAEYGDALFVGGSFTHVGGRVASSAALWNGAAWEPLGTGPNNLIRTLVSDPSGLLAIGEFTVIGDVEAKYIARWREGRWEPLGTNLRHYPAMACSFRGRLFACENSSGPTGGYLHEWDGTNWVRSAGQPSRRVDAMLEYRDELIIGGSFDAVGAQPISQIARWDGQTWRGLGQGVSALTFTSLTRFGDDLIVGGRIVSAGGFPVNNIARWDGQEWHAMGEGVNGYIYASAVHNGELFIGGTFTLSGGREVARVARWDGANWQPLGAGLDDTVRSLASTRAGLVAGGEFRNSGSRAMGGIARWTGMSWEPMTSQLMEDVRALAVYENELFVGGSFGPSLGQPGANLTRWVDGGVPEIVSRPANAESCRTGAATFEARASGTLENTYRWRRNGTLLIDGVSASGAMVSGAETARLVIANPAVSDAGQYDCIVSNPCGDTTTSPASLSVCPAAFNLGLGEPCDSGVGAIFSYLGAYAAGDRLADMDDGSGSGTPDGGVTIEDLLYFLVGFDAGC